MVEVGEGGGFSWGGVEGREEKAYNCNWITIKILKKEKKKKNFHIKKKGKFLLRSALATLLLKLGSDPEKRRYPDLSLKGLVQSHKGCAIFLPSQIPGCPMWPIPLGPSSLTITVILQWSKKDSSFNVQPLPSHSLLVSGLRDKPLS